MRWSLLVEEDFFRVDYLAAAHPEIVCYDFVITKNAAVMKFDEFIRLASIFNAFRQHCRVNKFKENS